MSIHMLKRTDRHIERRNRSRYACAFPNNCHWWNGALLMIAGECAAAFQMDCSKTETEDDGSVQ